MSNNSKNQTANGAKATEKNTESTLTAKGTPPPAAQPEKKDEQKPKPKTTAQIFEKSKQMGNTIEKIKSLHDAATDLDSLNLGKPSSNSDFLKITDGSNHFTTNNVKLVEDCVKYLQNRVEVRTAELEKELVEIENS